MPANVDSMFSVREMPWHREGLVLEEYPGSWEEARKLAGLDWEPQVEPVFKLDGIDDEGQPRYKPIDGWQLITRPDTGTDLWINQESYELIDHAAMGLIIEAILEQTNVKWETAGVLNGGLDVWVLALLDEPIELPGDKTITLPYLSVTSSHGKPGACTARALMTRIVCANTFRAAELEGERTGATYSFRHTKNWKNRIEQAREAVTGARREIEAYRELAHSLLGIRITPEQRETFILEFIPAPPTGLATDRVLRNVESSRTKLRELFDSPTTEFVAHTAYGLVQAAGEYLDHVRRANTWETKLGRTIIRSEPGKARALSLVRELVKA